MGKSKKGLFTRSGAARAAGCSQTTLVNYERRKIIRPLRLHGDSGRGYASMLVSAGVSIKVVQRLMGHASIQMTLGTYSHLLPGDDTGAAAAISTQVFGAVGGHVQRDRPASDGRRTGLDG